MFLAAPKTEVEGFGLVSISMNNPDPIATLTASDLATFARLGIPQDLLRQAQVERVSDHDARERFGILGHGDKGGIIFPHLDPETGRRVTARLRRDNPEIEAGRPKNKYVSAFGDRRQLYFPPDCNRLLKDQAVPILFIEAEKSCLALYAWAARMAREYVPVGMGGCYGWRGRIGKVENANGERVDEVGALRDLRCASDDRTAIVLLDSNASSNPKVKTARTALVHQLQKQGARVFVAELPATDGVNGPDDYIAVCGDAAMAAVLDAAEEVGVKASGAGPYSIVDGCICRTTIKDDGPVVKPLCNFSAKVQEQIVIDNGVESSRAFVISGMLASGKQLPVARVPASRFSGMNWIPECWGLDAIMNAGFSTKDHLREAIQRLSPNSRLRQVFAHTGWREINGKWMYLTANGAVGHEGIEVELGGDLGRYSVTAAPALVFDAMRVSLSLFDIGSLRVTVPLWSAMYASVLASPLQLPFSLWVHGPTGSLKSTMCSLFLCHFGQFNENTLPGNWSSTANQLEKTAFTLKDLPFVVDDFAPSGMDTRDLELKAARILRAQGNLAGRGRLRSDLSQRPTWQPRGLIIGTGEQFPSQQSVVARTLLIEVDRTQIDVVALTRVQKESALLQHAMAGFIEWLAPQMNELPSALRSAFENVRTMATSDDDHLRLPGNLSALWIGLDYGLRYAIELGVLSEGEAATKRDAGWDALLGLGRQQARIIEGERPSRRFLSVLAAMVSQGRALLLRRDSHAEDYFGNANVLGWQDAEFIYLIPDAAYQAAVRFCRDAGECFPVRSERLFRDLNREQLSECSPGRNTAVARLGGQVRRVIKLKRVAVETLLGEAMPGASDVTAVTNVTSSEE